MELTHTTPGLLFPAISLILIAYSNRFQSLATLIRDLHSQYLAEREQHFVAQIWTASAARRFDPQHAAGCHLEQLRMCLRHVSNLFRLADGDAMGSWASMLLIL